MPGSRRWRAGSLPSQVLRLLDRQEVPVAKEAIERIGKFYEIEAKARFAPPDERLAMRAETTRWSTHS